MLTVILVRHGHTDWNAARRYQGQIDTELNMHGLAQADMLAQGLAGVHIDLAFSSPLQRAYLTCQKIAALHSAPIFIDKRLIEIHYGDWQGMTAPDIAKNYPELWQVWASQAYKVKMPGKHGESLEIVRRRIKKAFAEYAELYDGKTILVSAHSTVNGVILCELFGMGMKRFNYIEQDNCCINVLEYKRGAWFLRLMNSTKHMGYLFNSQHILIN